MWLTESFRGKNTTSFQCDADRCSYTNTLSSCIAQSVNRTSSHPSQSARAAGESTNKVCTSVKVSDVWSSLVPPGTRQLVFSLLRFLIWDSLLSLLSVSSFDILPLCRFQVRKYFLCWFMLSNSAHFAAQFIQFSQKMALPLELVHWVRVATPPLYFTTFRGKCRLSPCLARTLPLGFLSPMSRWKTRLCFLTVCMCPSTRCSILWQL